MPATYLTIDAIQTGVGVAQVLPYVEGLGRAGVPMRLHTFEHRAPDPDLAERLRAAGVEWRAHRFGAFGPVGGLGRVLRAARACRGDAFVHARSDLAAGAAMLAGAERLLWDVRSFFADQRVALGTLRAGGPEERVLRRIEAAAAVRSDRIVTLSRAAVAVLTERYGQEVGAKAEPITTCVDLERFAATAMPQPPLHFLLSGSLNTYYDVPAMLRLVERAQARGSAALTVLTPERTPWDARFAAAGATTGEATPAEMPGRIAASHVGLSVCRADAGVSLRAAMPTKIGEFLAVGRPVVVNAGLGDMDEMLADGRCGVVLAGDDDVSLDTALDRLEALVAHPDTVEACRALAERHFSLERGVERLLELYRQAGVQSR